MKNYIQIGANVGRDDFQKLVENISEEIMVVLIEPNIDLLDELNNNYETLKKRHRIVILSYAISPISGDVDFYLRTDIKQFGGSSLINRKSYPLDKMRNVTGKTLNDLCDELLITEIECLSIDTEGLDYEILNSIDFSELKINTIFCEKWNHMNDDLNGTYRTGNKFLNENIVPKFKNYHWEEITMGGQPTIKMTIIKNDFK